MTALLGGQMLPLLAALLGPIPPCPRICECAPTESVPVAFKSVDAVFLGRAISVKDSSRVIEKRRPEVRWRVRAFTFVVTQSWKGVTSDTVTVFTGYGDGDCGYPFNVGSSYLVYGSRFDRPSDGVSTGICSRTIFVEAAGSDIEELNRLRPPRSTTRPGPAR